MRKSIREVMTADPVTLNGSRSLQQARIMRDQDMHDPISQEAFLGGLPPR
jgi:hypothetical protein